MKTYNFIIGPTDTDSISYCKADMTPFTPEELSSLLNELNEISPEYMLWEDDGYYPACIALKAKNYVLWDGKKKTIKGSGFKTSSKEIALKELMENIVDAIIAEREDQLVNIYHNYIKEALNVQDIRRWTQKKTITQSILKCRNPKEKCRKNERDVWDALKHEEDIQEGNKIYLYPVILGNDEKPGKISEKTGKQGKSKIIEITGLKLDKHWTGDHNTTKLIERVYDTISIFESVLNMDQFINYGLSKNKKLLENLK